jgi:hypothetical protein
VTVAVILSSHDVPVFVRSTVMVFVPPLVQVYVAAAVPAPAIVPSGVAVHAMVPVLSLVSVDRSIESPTATWSGSITVFLRYGHTRTGTTWPLMFSLPRAGGAAFGLVQTTCTVTSCVVFATIVNVCVPVQASPVVEVAVNFTVYVPGLRAPVNAEIVAEAELVLIVLWMRGVPVAVPPV